MPLVTTGDDMSPYFFLTKTRLLLTCLLGFSVNWQNRNTVIDANYAFASQT